MDEVLRTNGNQTLSKKHNISQQFILNSPVPSSRTQMNMVAAYGNTSANQLDQIKEKVPKVVNHRLKSNKSPSTNLGIYKNKSQVSLVSGEEAVTRQG